MSDEKKHKKTKAYKDPGIRRHYMCKFSWLEEFGTSEVIITDSLHELAKVCPCIKECGAVELTIVAKDVNGIGDDYGF